MKLSRHSWWYNICMKKILLFHIRDVQRNAYFYSCKYHRERSRVLSQEGTKSEALQGWLVKLGDYSKQLCTTVEILVNWLSNRNPPPGRPIVHLYLAA